MPKASTINEETLMALILAVKTLIVYAITLGSLALCFLCLLPFYLTAFMKHAEAYAGPFLILIRYTYRNLKFNYVIFFISGTAMISVSRSRLPMGAYITGLFYGSALALNWFCTMYQLFISIISIHRFINSRQPEEFRSSLSRKNVTILVFLTLFIVIMKDIGLVIWLIIILASQQYELILTVALYYGMTYITHQIILFIGFAFQLAVKRDPMTSHSENVIAIHTKAIGGIKFTLFVIAFISQLTGYETIITSTVYSLVDLFLVPVVIEITEIRTDPNVIKPCEVKMDTLKV